MGTGAIVLELAFVGVLSTRKALTEALGVYGDRIGVAGKPSIFL